MSKRLVSLHVSRIGTYICQDRGWLDPSDCVHVLDGGLGANDTEYTAIREHKEKCLGEKGGSNDAQRKDIWLEFARVRASIDGSKSYECAAFASEMVGFYDARWGSK